MAILANENPRLTMEIKIQKKKLKNEYDKV
jgi:hypothetical protein